MNKMTVVVDGISASQLSQGLIEDAGKRCPGCKEVKPLDAFNKNRSTTDGRCSRCRVCDRNYYNTVRGRLRIYYAIIVQQCADPNDTRYGGAGVKCEITFKAFYAYITLSLGISDVEILKTLQVHRTDPKRGFCLGNIEMLTQEEHTAVHRLRRRLRSEELG